MWTNYVKYFFSVFVLLSLETLNAQVANDDCISAQAITIPASGNVCITSTTVNAISDNSTNTCDTGTPGNEVWFTFIATGSQNTITVTPTGSPAIQQAVVSIDGTGCADAAYNACGVSATNNGTATATWTFSPGTQVWISVESNNGTQGGFQLCVTSVTPPPTPGSSCSTATPLCNLNNFTLNPFPANNNGFIPQCFLNTALQQPVFYQFTVGQTGTLQWTADVQGTAEYDWALYNITGGCPSNSTTPVACNYNFANGNSNIIGMQAGPGTCSGEFCDPVTVTAGQTYMLIIDNFSNNSTGFIMSFAGSTFLMAPTAQFTVTPATACGSANVTITNSSVSASSYNWNFGNGNTSTAQNPPPQNYTTPGTYLISLTASSPAGCTNTTSQSVIVNANHTITNGSSQTLCVSTALTPITMTLGGGATGATASGLPPGVTSSVSAGVVTLSGTPNTPGTYSYTITTTGNACTPATTTGTITVNPTNTVNAASSNPTICEGSALTSITFTTTGATGIGSPTGLPAGVTSSFSGNTITVSGTPTATGTFNYTIPLTGGCGTINATGTISINPNNTVSAPSVSPSLCIGSSISPSITFTTSGATGIGASTGLPSGVSASFASNTITISGTPTNTGTFNYSIPLTGGCGSFNAIGTITVIDANTVSSPSSNPSICVNTLLSPNVTFTTSGATGIGTSTGLPNGITASFSNNTITISGTPTASGTFNYTIPLTGGCGNISATGTITVNAENTVSAASSNPTLCANSLITPSITFNTTGATGIGSATGLPAGVSASFAGNTITVSGTPTETGTFNYSIPLTGGCGSLTALGTITVTPSNSVSAASSNPTLCLGTAISPDITYTTSGATGIGSASGLPAGTNAVFSGNTITISGTPTVTGTFNYTVPLTGGCGTLNATGTITVIDANSVGTPSSNPTLCINTLLTPNITFTSTGATGIGTPNGLPSGVSATFANNTITISGTPTASGTFSYTIPLTGGCGTVDAIGTITVNPTNTVSNASSNPTLCINTAINPAITFNTTGATGIGTSTGLPAGVTASYSNNTISVSGTPTTSGTFNYSIPLTGGCGNLVATGTIIVNPLVNPSFNTWGPYCQNDIITQVMLPNTSNNGINGTWNPGMLSTGTAGSSTYVFTPGTSECASSYSMVVVVNAPIQPIFTQLGPYCQGGTAGSLSNLSTNNPSISGSWSPATISTNTVGTTTYTFTPSNGQCANEATMNVIVNATPSPSISASQTSGCTPLNVTFGTSNIPGVQYSWSVNGTNFGSTSNPTYLFEQGGCFDISLTVSSNGCSSSTTELDLVCVESPPNASFSSNPSLFTNNSENIIFTNNTTGAVDYLWDFGDLSSSTDENPTHLYTNIQGGVLVTLTATSSLGCTDQATLVINYQEQTIFYVPNSFTPDQDEYNQTWGPVFTQGFDPYSFDLYIYDRWGELIWESHDSQAKWDGSVGVNGIKCQDGVYTWKINYKPKETDEKKVVTGFINLIR